jgi:peptide deformylase
MTKDIITLLTGGIATLTKKSDEMDPIKDKKEISQIFDDLIDTLSETGGLGLAAPQIDIRKRLFIMVYGNQYLKILNPKIISVGSTIKSREGCLSLPGEFYDLTRYNKVKVEYIDGDTFELVKRKFTKQDACIFQHENDHLDGILISKGE